MIDNSFLNESKAIDRLLKEHKEHNNLIIGFDFDNTIYDYHGVGLVLSPVVKLLQQCVDAGFTMCLYTLPDRLDFKIEYCTLLGITPEYVNESPVMPNPTKPYFNLLLDDRAGLASAVYQLTVVLEKLGFRHE